MIMKQDEQKIDVRISDIIVSIAPAAVRTLIGVTSSLGTLQVKNFFSKFRRILIIRLDNGIGRKRKSQFEIDVYTKTIQRFEFLVYQR